MHTIPNVMYSSYHDCKIDNRYEDSELLFRRFPLGLFVGERVHINAVTLPDMSCNRSKHGGRPEFVLISPAGNYHDWGIAQFSAGQLPSPHFDEGVPFYSSPRHVPLRRNYFHTEIRSYDVEGNRISDSSRFGKDALARWRYRLLCELKVVKKPGESS